MIDFLLLAVQRASFEQLMQREGFMDASGQPALGADIDPAPGTPEYATGIPIVAPASPKASQGLPSEALAKEGGPPEFVQGFSANVRLSGALEQAQIAGIPQTDEQGNLLPLRERSKFGQTMSIDGVEWIGMNGITTGISDGGVTFIDPESIASQQRVWQ
jgi:hypothetical protein